MNHMPRNPFIDLLQNEEVKELFTLERTILEMAWMLDVFRLLAVLAAGFAALFFYFMPLDSDVPFYLGYLHFFVYLSQGVFLLWRSERWTAEWTDRKKPWWRHGIAVLGWPMHFGLVVFHQKVHRFSDAHPPHMMTIDWLKTNLFFSVAHGARNWFLGLMGSFLVVIITDQVLQLV